MSDQYSKIAKESRIKCLELVFKAQTSHIGSLFSCADILAVLFEKIDLNKDRFILSAGWKACMLYFHLWRKGRITEEELNSYCQEGSKFIGLVEPMNRWGLRFAGGSMGYGLPAAVGFALSKKLKGEEGKVYVLMSDGEMQCGTTWESALIAAHHKLDNLVVIVDDNKFQAMGKTEEILNSEFPYVGWVRSSVDGHNYIDLETILSGPTAKGKPGLIIAHTIKGKGVSFMENDNLYHYKNLDEEEYNLALKELNGL